MYTPLITILKKPILIVNESYEHEILIGCENNFAMKLTDSTTQGLPFDHASFTLANTEKCSRNTQPTFVVGGFGIMRRKKQIPSPLDFLHLNILYCRGEH